VRRVLITGAIVVVLAGIAAWFGLALERSDLAEWRAEEMPGRLIETGEHRTHVLAAGEPTREAVVLLHGGTVPAVMWDGLVAPLVAGGLRVIRYDQYGRGLSDRLDGPYDRAAHRDQLAAVLDAMVGDAPVHLVGTSFGGALATSFAARHPKRVRSVLLIAPVLDYGDNLPSVLRVPLLGEFVMRVAGVRMARARIQPWARSIAGGEAVWRVFDRQSRTVGFEHLLLSLARDGALGDYRSDYAALGATDLPVLLLWGEEDAEMPADHMAAIRERIPSILYRPVAGAGHAIAASHPQRVIEALRALRAVAAGDDVMTEGR